MARASACSRGAAAVHRSDTPALSGKEHLVGETFTYADIAMAVTLQFVAPVDGRFIALGPATRAACTHKALAARYADLIAWRDALYDRHRAGAG